MSNAINVYSAPEVHTAIEESLPAVFSRLGYKQDFRLLDTRLLLGYLTAITAAVSFVLDRKFKWDDVLIYQKALVGLYVVFSSAFWLFSRYGERHAVYQGQQGQERITVRMQPEPGSEHSLVTLEDGAGGRLEARLAAPGVFSADGHLQFGKLHRWFEEQLGLLVQKKRQ
ncbi:AER112Cp [Eremothecium gossypii ATCC 10895]|uniref:Signal peptidase complex subunit 2 n=1 Tax=Eremothecium gossypii (strain ATCC 10895 / CBS 109.51 / FGSC 9923 / NRRL Y-1056) TaxID=284811 RepID=Q757A1_EREGS|nr:AER112Cp [Eremothecium gossypii ATCC 10895]AAS52796.1 AER112Cp [Eremothecium gossypii ATCC 10895]AEY97102.1 FAER112Cp [Eremothecium gossypii FDAG1]